MGSLFVINAECFSWAARYLTTAPRTAARAKTFLEPLIEEMQKGIDQYGKEYPDKKVRMDFLSQAIR